MRAQLIHLSGTLRGKTRTYDGDRLLIGTDPDAAIRYPKGTGVDRRHAELSFHSEGCAFHLRAIDGQVFVNQMEVKEVILSQGDLLEFGTGGPKARFRVYAEKGAVCKPVRVMIGDAQDVGREGGLFAFTGSITRDLLTHASLRLKVGVPLVALALFIPFAFLAGWLGAGGTYSRMREERAVEIEQAVSAVRQEFQKIRERQDVSREEVETLRLEFDRRAEVVDRMVASNAALERAHTVYPGGVCLIHGIFGLRDAASPGRGYIEQADGSRLEIEYTGSGFLVDGEGSIVTNRHVAVPWEFERDLERLLSLGFEPEFFHFAATFPGREPVPIDATATQVRDDGIDVAVVHVSAEDVEGVPLLPIGRADPIEHRGRAVLLIGYPTGINALLAKADPRVSETVTAGRPAMTDIIAGLAANDAITPVITRGSLSEVLPHQLVYDAETTAGGSGGPVVGEDGEVIGVNFAVLRGFSGSNFGVPIRFALELLE